ncbi:carboxylesterase/lipase family protein [Microlunatus soli]|uniref:Carboxylic ester hydrolase n=1 Tax=Microlunatus soli TaxID=630515 RepID=A0A1H1YNM4_9ACTN|nr:carboxylesterase family protein [Microlunatus soli]SDT23055.1 para-nitrobenzyl esterase [Microlunatus soli]
MLETWQGRLRGADLGTPDGAAVGYLNIPYAPGPVDGRRWMPPAGPIGWTGERDGTRFGPGAPQRADRAVGFSTAEEGCLNLNVWAPATSAEPRPVLVWLHGGAHLYGSNTHPLCDGARLAAAEGIIVVAANYRLGALGYLTLDHLLGESYGQSANLALLDALAALRWVQRSITAFGGDPERVTLMGQSAGAVMTATLLGLPAARGLFGRAIVESGSAERCQDREFGIRRTADLLAILGLTEATAGRLLALPAAQLIDAQEQLIKERSRGSSTLSLAFGPEVDGRLLYQRPVDAIAAGEGADVDLIAGTNLNEGSGYVDLRRGDDPALVSELRARTAELLPRCQDPVSDYRAAVEGDLGRSATTAEVLEACVADQLYRQPIQRLLDARAAADDQQRTGRTFSYLFGWPRPDHGWARRAGHSLELPFIFRHLDDKPEAAEEVGPDAPIAIRDLMSRSWARFAANGDPTSEHVSWRTYGSERSVLMITDHPTVVADPRRRLRMLSAAYGADRTTIS